MFYPGSSCIHSNVSSFVCLFIIFVHMFNFMFCSVINTFDFQLIRVYIRLTKWLASRNGQFRIFVNNSFLNIHLGSFVVTM